MNKWNLVSQVLPEIGQDVLVSDDQNKVYISSVKWSVQGNNKITAWQPLPTLNDRLVVFEQQIEKEEKERKEKAKLHANFMIFKYGNPLVYPLGSGYNFDGFEDWLRSNNLENK